MRNLLPLFAALAFSCGTPTPEPDAGTQPRCGDGIVQAGEACDDGNESNIDGCRNDCSLPSCGNGTVDPGEQCDDGNSSNIDACTNACLLNVCGDGFIQDGVEVCDDGNTSNTDSCRNDCSLPVCGDGNLQPGEACDDGNTASAECDPDCTAAACGDGFVNTAAGESCDDRNTNNSDGCTSLCVAKANTAPVATPVSLFTDEGSPRPLVLAGSDPDGEPVTFAVVTPPQHGALSGTPPQLTYVPHPQFSGSDNFTFKVNDGFADSAPATVSLTVRPTAVALPRRVLAVVFEPKVNGQRLTTVHGWQDPYVLLPQVADWWSVSTGGRVQYQLVDTITVEAFPVKFDGFSYDAAGYEQVMAQATPAHSPDGVDYLAVLAAHNVCNRVNSGDVDELWMMGGPYFGFNESAIAGPGAFEYNGPAITTSTCQRLLPIMGFNYERALPEAIHDFGHRAEATLAHLYGGWSEDSIATDWNRFGLVASQSPTLGFSGCGSIHYPPTAVQDYQYDNATPVLSACDDFANFPALAANAQASAVPMTCAAWGCTELGFYAWWFQHLPEVPGKDASGKPTDWLRAVVDPWWMVKQVPHAIPCALRADAAFCTQLGDCQWAPCASTCLPTGITVDTQACACLQQATIPTCNATPGCAFYGCSGQCLAVGTDTDTACP